MRRTYNLIACASAVLLLCSFLQQPQIRVEVEAVNVLVTVTDQKGRFVTGLTRDRFRVYEDGVPQQITNFSSQAGLPLTLALLIDTSASVRLTLDFQKKAATDFLHAVMQPQDRALLVAFDTGVSPLHDFTNNPGALAKEIRALSAGGGTAVFNALYTVCREKMSDDSIRKAIVLISDGEDRQSTRSFQETLEIAQQSDVIIYAIGTTRLSASPSQEGEELLGKLAEETGGRAFFPYSTDQLAHAFERINEELRSQYNLAYVPTKKTKDRRFREIEVKIDKGKGLIVNHRKGYFAPSVIPLAETALMAGVGKPPYFTYPLPARRTRRGGQRQAEQQQHTEQVIPLRITFRLLGNRLSTQKSQQVLQFLPTQQLLIVLRPFPP